MGPEVEPLLSLLGRKLLLQPAVDGLLGGRGASGKRWARCHTGPPNEGWLGMLGVDDQVTGATETSDALSHSCLLPATLERTPGPFLGCRVTDLAKTGGRKAGDPSLCNHGREHRSLPFVSVA